MEAIVNTVTNKVIVYVDNKTLILTIEDTQQLVSIIATALLASKIVVTIP